MITDPISQMKKLRPSSPRVTELESGGCHSNQHSLAAQKPVH